MCWQDVQIARSTYTKSFGIASVNLSPDTARPADPGRVGLSVGFDGVCTVNFVGNMSSDDGLTQVGVGFLLDSTHQKVLRIEDIGLIITQPYYITGATGTPAGVVYEHTLPLTGPSGDGLNKGWPGTGGR